MFVVRFEEIQKRIHSDSARRIPVKRFRLLPDKPNVKEQVFHISKEADLSRVGDLSRVKIALGTGQ